MFAACFSHFYLTIFSYNIPIEFANRIMDMFWIFDEKAIFDSLIHIIKLQESKLLKMSLDVRINKIGNNSIH
jgi:hypothetical protein